MAAPVPTAHPSPGAPAPADPSPPTGPPTGAGDRRLAPTARTLRSSVIRDLLRLTDAPDVLNMAGGLPAPELLPVGRLAEAAAAVLRRAGRRAIQYGPTEGMDELRVRVAAGVDADPDRVLVTTGSQQGLDLAVRTLVGPGEVLVAEAPSYLGALQVAAAAGARIETVAGDADGLDVDLLAARLAGGLRPKLCYVVSEFANPSGATLSEDRRRRLVELARRYEFVIIEDDPYGALRIRGAAPPPMRRHGPDVVVAVRTLSKTIGPGLRVGWLAPPEWLWAALVRAKQSADLHTAGLNQLMAADVLSDEPFMDAHLAVIRSHYADRQAALCSALEATFGSSLRVLVPDGGMFVWAELVDPALPDADRLLPAALAAGTAFVPGSAFHADGRGARHLRLCCSTLDPPRLAEAVDRLARAARRSRPD